MTNEELYERITSVLKEQCIGMSQLELKIKSETGKNINAVERNETAIV